MVAGGQSRGQRKSVYQRVLVPLDGSRESEQALALARAKLAPDGELFLLRVIPPGRSATVGAHYIMGNLLEELDHRESQRYLQSLGWREIRNSATWRAEVAVSRSVAEGIANFARQHDIDLIAMYTNNRGLLGRMFNRSVTREVRRLRPTEVLAVGPIDVAGYALEAPTEADPGIEAGSFKHVDVFEGLSDDQIERVVSLGKRLHIPAGEMLGKGGEQAESLFVILKGEADLCAHSEIGEIAVRITRPGESFPLAALLGSGTLITSGEALSDMDVLAIPRSQLLLLCSKDTEIGMKVHFNVAQLFAGRYSETLTQLATSAEREVRDAEALEN